MICPQCETGFDILPNKRPLVFPKSDNGDIYIVSWVYCTNNKCNQIILTLKTGRMKSDLSKDFKIENVESINNDEEIIYPIKPSTAPMPTKGMPDNIKEDYMEARAVVDVSPRSAIALLRLCTENLVNYLEIKGKNLNEKIDNLEKSGYSKDTIIALDLLREIGNSAIHRLDENTTNHEIALGLFKAFNMVVNEIVERKEVNELLHGMPEKVRQRIENRFAKKDEGE